MAGHTEAGVDQQKWLVFNLPLIVEIMNEDGSMARRPELRSLLSNINSKWEP